MIEHRQPQQIQREGIKTNERISSAVDFLRKRGEQVHPLVFEYFQDQSFLQALPEKIVNDEQQLAELILNTSNFFNIISAERKKRSIGDISGIFGEEVHAEETVHSNGREREAESGSKINVDFLRSQGIDPKKVLFFRVTQPASQPKPEYYWTSDYFETQHGLTQEIPVEQRKTAVILVASLDVINGNDGLIEDMNDDSGLAVRQIGTANFDQSLAMTAIQSYK